MPSGRESVLCQQKILSQMTLPKICCYANSCPQTLKCADDEVMIPAVIGIGKVSGGNKVTDNMLQILLRRTELYKLVEQKYWNKATNRVMTHPNEGQSWVHKLLSALYLWGHLPMHHFAIEGLALCAAVGRHQRPLKGNERAGTNPPQTNGGDLRILSSIKKTSFPSKV